MSCRTRASSLGFVSPKRTQTLEGLRIVKSNLVSPFVYFIRIIPDSLRCLATGPSRASVSRPSPVPSFANLFSERSPSRLADPAVEDFPSGGNEVEVEIEDRRLSAAASLPNPPPLHSPQMVTRSQARAQRQDPSTAPSGSHIRVEGRLGTPRGEPSPPFSTTDFPSISTSRRRSDSKPGPKPVKVSKASTRKAKKTARQPSPPSVAPSIVQSEELREAVPEVSSGSLSEALSSLESLIPSVS